MKSLVFTLFVLSFSTSAFAAGKKFCHFNYQMITNADVPVDSEVTDKAANSPGGGAIFFYEISAYELTGDGAGLEAIAQLDCEDSSADKDNFKKIMLEKCESIHMGGITVPMSEDFDFSKACG